MVNSSKTNKTSWKLQTFFKFAGQKIKIKHFGLLNHVTYYIVLLCLSDWLVVDNQLVNMLQVTGMFYLETD